MITIPIYTLIYVSMRYVFVVQGDSSYMLSAAI
jgi:hypothetical protein